MKALNYTIIVLYFFYFVSLLSGFYGPNLSPQMADPSQTGHTQNKQSAEDFHLDPMAEDYEPAQIKMQLQWAWQPGLIKLLAIQTEALRIFQDPLLENDSRPDKFFEELDRSYAASVARLVLTIFWCLGLILVFLALARNQWYYRPMSSIIFVISLIVLMVILSTSRKIQINQFTQISLYPVFLAGFEFSLVLMTALLLLMRTLPYPKINLESGFMEHLKLPSTKIPKRIMDSLHTSLHILLIMICGIVISNVFLLPLYKIQVNFQGLFALILAVIIGVLTLWYIRAYVGLAKEKTQKKDYLSGIAFLGYRFLKNTLFIGTVVVIVAIVLTLIVVISTINTDVLQLFNLIPVQESL